MQKQTILINLFGGPGAGKTVAAMEIAVGLKKLGYEVEYLSEYAKQLYYEGNLEMLDGSLLHEIEIITEIYNRLMTYNGKVDVIVSDSALLQSVNYVHGLENKKEMLAIAYDYHRQFLNINFMVARNHDFKTEGRVHSFEESVKIDEEILLFMEKIEPLDIIDDRNDRSSINRQIFNIATLLDDLHSTTNRDVPSIGREQKKKDALIYHADKNEGYYKNFKRYYKNEDGPCYLPKSYFKAKEKDKAKKIYTYKDFLRIAKNTNEANRLFEDVNGELPETLQRKINNKINQKLTEALAVFE